MNAALIFEIAVLMLAAFLAGAVLGVAARWLMARRKPKAEAATVAPVAAPAAKSAQPQLVTAPEIAPLRTPAERLAAAAGGMSATVVMPKVSLPAAPAIQPSRRPGETVSGRHIENPEHPVPAPVAPEAPPAPDAQPLPPEPIARPEVAPIAASTDAVDDPSSLAPAAAAVVDPAIDMDGAGPDSVLGDAPVADLPPAAQDDAPLPVEERREPELAPDDLVLTDAPTAMAEDLQDVIETAVDGVAPDVMAEAPLVEPAVERDQHEVDEAIVAPIRSAPEDAPPQPVPEPEPGVVPPVAPTVPPTRDEIDDELAAMRAIEGGWQPRRRVAARQPADLPEGVSAAQVAAADAAVEKAGAAVANALATAAAVLEEIAAPVPVAPLADLQGRPPALDQPRNGVKDELGQIQGLAPAIESALNGLGIYHFDQVATWDAAAVSWIETHFGFKGRVAREKWQEQARDLAAARASASESLTR